jgi:hypothetical protein
MAKKPRQEESNGALNFSRALVTFFQNAKKGYPMKDRPSERSEQNIQL